MPSPPVHSGKCLHIERLRRKFESGDFPRFTGAFTCSSRRVPPEEGKTDPAKVHLSKWSRTFPRVFLLAG